jgi:hypothetical protein
MEKFVLAFLSLLPREISSAEIHYDLVEFGVLELSLNIERKV